MWRPGRLRRHFLPPGSPWIIWWEQPRVFWKLKSCEYESVALGQDEKKEKMYIQVIIKYQFFYAQYLFAKKKGAILTRLWGKIWCVGSREVTLCSPTVGASPCAQGIMKISVPEFVTHLKGRQTNRCHFLRHNGESFCVRTQIGLHEPENGTIST